MFYPYVFEVLSQSWDRPFKEITAKSVYETDKGFLYLINAIGIEEKDITIEKLGRKIVVKGSTTISLGKEKFENKLSHVVDISGIGNLKEIEYEAKNGYVFIYLNVDKEKEVKINAVKK
jgi:HSP20 family molecular chaperone IbpA